MTPNKTTLAANVTAIPDFKGDDDIGENNGAIGPYF
jgi:hypothetical protein